MCLQAAAYTFLRTQWKYALFDDFVARKISSTRSCSRSPLPSSVPAADARAAGYRPRCGPTSGQSSAGRRVPRRPGASLQPRCPAWWQLHIGVFVVLVLALVGVARLEGTSRGAHGRRRAAGAGALLPERRGGGPGFLRDPTPPARRLRGLRRRDVLLAREPLRTDPDRARDAAPRPRAAGGDAYRRAAAPFRRANRDERPARRALAPAARGVAGQERLPRQRQPRDPDTPQRHPRMARLLRGTRLGPEQQEYADVIHSQGRALLATLGRHPRLLEDRGGPPGAGGNRLRLHDMLEELVRSFRDEARDKDIGLDWSWRRGCPLACEATSFG